MPARMAIPRTVHQSCWSGTICSSCSDSSHTIPLTAIFQNGEMRNHQRYQSPKTPLTLFTYPVLLVRLGRHFFNSSQGDRPLVELDVVCRLGPLLLGIEGLWVAYLLALSFLFKEHWQQISLSCSLLTDKLGIGRQAWNENISSVMKRICCYHGIYFLEVWFALSVLYISDHIFVGVDDFHFALKMVVMPSLVK